jgi:hypothetical protein
VSVLLPAGCFPLSGRKSPCFSLPRCRRYSTVDISMAMPPSMNNIICCSIIVYLLCLFIRRKYKYGMWKWRRQICTKKRHFCHHWKSWSYTGKNYELSELWIINYELWIMNWELRIMNYKLWIMNYELWIMNYELRITLFRQGCAQCRQLKAQLALKERYQ